MTDPSSKEQSFYLQLSERPPTETCRELLDKYSKVSRNEVDDHISAVRDDAWNHYPYPSIGLFVFLDLGLCGDDLPKDLKEITQSIQTSYQTILSKLKNGGKFLDVGCMFAQDTRKLVYDGAPASSVYGTDLHGEYFEYGYKLFRDEAIIPKDHFIAADILNANAPGLKDLQSTFDVINAVHLIHVFTLEDQHALLKRFITLLKPEKGTMITGRCTGHVKAGYYGGENTKQTTKSRGDIWEHNAESIKKMFADVGTETGTEWEVNSEFWQFGSHTGGFKENWFRNKDHGIVTFFVTRV